MWRDWAVPLIVDANTGEVRYGKKQLCEPGSVRWILLACSSYEEESHSCGFAFVLDYGVVKKIPSGWFGMLTKAEASELADMIASLLKVSVCDE